MSRACGRLLLALAAAGCGSTPPEKLPPQGHVLLHVDTDAPVAAAPGVARDPERPSALFDRLRVEVFTPGAGEPCADCARELVLTEDVLLAGGSFSIVPTDSRVGLRVRLRMFRSASLDDGALVPEATVEVVARLPDVPESGYVEASIFLATDDVGRPVGTLDDPVAATEGEPRPSRVGTWPGARRVGCAEAPRPGEVCVPGGAFWMGNPLASAFDDAKLAGTRQRLVVLSPFYLDAREATVADFRSSGVDPTGTVAPWSGQTRGTRFDDWCTYAAAPDAERDRLPLSCVSWVGAREYCRARGADLPTEAQHEYVAGALESRTYVWGTEPPTCDDAVWGRGRGTFLGVARLLCADRLAPGDIGGAVSLPDGATPATAAPPRARDWVELPGGVVFDLAGNLAEWTLDRFNRQDEPCWAAPETNVFVEPVCNRAGEDGDLRSLRGGAWGGTVASLTAARRRAEAPDAAVMDGGVRCARPAVPSL